MNLSSEHIPLVSVIMPFHNVAHHIHAAISSILNQTHQHLELILCNDGSTDKSEEVALSFQDKRIVYLKNPEKKGIPVSRNACLKSAKGVYIAVLDSDDIALPDRIEKQVAFLEGHPEHILCGTYFRQFNEKGLLPSSDETAVSDEEIRTQFIFSNCILHSTLLFRKTDAEGVSYDEEMELCEDFDIIQRLGKKGKMHVIPEVKVLYRLHQQNVTRHRKEKILHYQKILFSRVLNDRKISHSQEELDIHLSFIYAKPDAFAGPVMKARLEAWLDHIEGCSQHFPEAENDLIRKNIAIRWMEICLKNEDWKELAKCVFEKSKISVVPFLFIKKFRNKWNQFLTKGRIMPLMHRQLSITSKFKFS
jgi:glycosyltransferase involved in cell wall biosynthesis